MEFVDPKNLSGSKPCLDKEENRNVTIDTELWKECFEYGGENMEDNIMPLLTPNSTSSFSDKEHEYGSLREEISPILCLPVTVEPLYLANKE